MECQLLVNFLEEPAVEQNKHRTLLAKLALFLLLLVSQEVLVLLVDQLLFPLDVFEHVLALGKRDVVREDF